MKNVIKGYISTLLGLAIMILDALFFFGAIHLPEPGFVPKAMEVGIAFFVGAVLFFVPYSKLEKFVEGILLYVWEWIKSKFTKDNEKTV